nr:transcriptional regulator [Roseateles aquatilis]
MHIRPIRNEADYKATLKLVSRLFNDPPRRGTAEGDRFEVLLALVEAYESKHHAIDPPDPIEAIKFRMEQNGLSIQDMTLYIGATNRVYEVLNHTRPLTLAMMRKLRKGLSIPGDVLLNESMPPAPPPKAGASKAPPPRAATKTRKPRGPHKAAPAPA